MSQNVITSLAILNVNWSQNSDFIQNFVPFVAECIRLAPNEVVSSDEVVASMRENFGFIIPHGAMRTILRRVEAKGYVIRRNGVYMRNDEKLASVNLAKLSASVVRQYDALLDKFIRYCDLEHRVTLTHDEAGDCFQAYLEEHSIPILAAAENGLPIVQPSQVARRSYFLVYSFVDHLDKSDPDGFEFLLTVVKGRMLADVLLFSDLGSVQRQFQNVVVFLDTPFLLKVLGLNGESPAAPCREMLDLLWQEKAQLCVFTHNFQELYDILYACEKALGHQGSRHAFTSETLEHFIRSGQRAGDVAQILAGLESTLELKNIRIVDTPLHTVALGVDLQKLAEYVRGAVRYRTDEVLETDLKSLTAIHRLRNGHLYHKIEDCKAIFVTSNSGLARSSLRFFKEEYPGYSVPHCMLDHVLSTLVWLKKPLLAPDLPKKRVIANCYAALNPNDALWRQYLAKIVELQQRNEITPNDVALLRYSPAARNTLVNITCGELEAFTDGTVAQVLERAKSEARREAVEQLATETDGRRRAEQARAVEASRRKEAELELERRSSSLQAKSAEALAAQERAELAEKVLEIQRSGAGRRAKSAGRWSAGIVAVILIVSLMLEVLHGLPWTGPMMRPLFGHWWQWIFHSLLAIAAGMFAYHAVKGRAIFDLITDI